MQPLTPLGEIRTRRLKQRMGNSFDLSNMQSFQVENIEEYGNDYIKKNTQMAQCHVQHETQKRILTNAIREHNIEHHRVKRREVEEMKRTRFIAALSKWENAKQLRLRNEVVKSIVFDRTLRARQWLKAAKFLNFIKAIHKHSIKYIEKVKEKKKEDTRATVIQRLFRSVFGMRGQGPEQRIHNEAKHIF
jgi:adenine specific DNA methylase Mod